MKAALVDKVLQRVGQLNPDELQSFLQRLSRQSTFLDTIFNALRDGVLVLDQPANLRYFNPAAANLLALDASALGTPISRHLRTVDWKAMLDPAGPITRDLEISYPESRYVNVYTIPVALDSGTGHAVILHDATESREAVREAAESERVNAVISLAAGVAHELGNPLNSLSIQLQLMERELRRLPAPTPHRMAEALRICRDEVARLDGMVRQFLTAVRPVPPDLRLLDINPVVHDALALFGPEIRDRDLLLETELAPSLPRVHLDPEQMKQVFYNVLRNAIQAMGSGGILRVSTAADGSGVTVSFQDSGGGIPPEVMARLFEPYHTTKEGGTGLGLVIVRRIVRAHGGEIQIESLRGRGTEVRIRLPLPGSRVRLLAPPTPPSAPTPPSTPTS